MTRLERIAVHVANILVTGTGLVYIVMLYFMDSGDEWAVVNHPWQPHVQHLHVLAAPLLVFTVGLIWSRHVVRKLRNGSRARSSGIGLLVGFVPMAVSGYWIQVAVDPGWRSAWIAIHLASSSLWVAAFALHQLRALLEGREDDPAHTDPVVEDGMRG